MITFCCISLTLCISSSTDGQSTPLFIVGDYLDMLQVLVKDGVILIEEPQLKADIAEGKLGAILVPAIDVQPDSGTLLLCDVRRTKARSDADIGEADIAVLRSYASDGVYSFIFQQRRAYVVGDVAERKRVGDEIERRVDSIGDPKRRAAVEHIVGYLMAQSEPTEPNLAKFVVGYRHSEEKRVRKNLAKNVEQYPDGEFAVFGRGEFDKASLYTKLLSMRNRMETIQEFEIDGRLYKQVWIESALIIVPQMKKRPDGMFDLSGIGAAEFMLDEHEILDRLKFIEFENVKTANYKWRSTDPGGP